MKFNNLINKITIYQIHTKVANNMGILGGWKRWSIVGEGEEVFLTQIIKGLNNHKIIDI